MMSETAAAVTPEELTATDARGRKFVLRVMDPGDTLDLLEAAGPASGNQGYMQYAMVVRSVASIDGLPLPVATSRHALRANAKTIGNDGIVAITAVLFGNGPTIAAGTDVETAKN